MTNSPVRVRFAPSPTGTLHVGNARTALINYLFARNQGGTFVLRIEDTDVERSTEVSEKGIIDDLNWLGISWDEGPFRQSERREIYDEHLQKLIDQGDAYYCFCTPEEVDSAREQQRADGIPMHYPGTHRDLPMAEAKQKIENGEPYVIRFRVPQDTIQFTDGVRGEITFDTRQLGGDFVLARSTGMPMYNFAVVIDDHLMGITHILRGEDHIANHAKQVMLYNAFGWSVPQPFHMAMVLGPDKSKLSKRHGATTIQQFRDEGIAADALVNFLALLGWSPGDNQEVLTPDQLIEQFTPQRLLKSASIFDTTKLEWINAQTFKAMQPEDFAQSAIDWLADHQLSPEFWTSQQQLERIPFFQSLISTYAQLPTYWPLFTNAEIEASDDVDAIVNDPLFQPILQTVQSYIEDATTVQFAELKTIVQEETGAKGKILFKSLRLLLSGQLDGPDLGTISEWMSPELIQQRISNLGALSA